MNNYKLYKEINKIKPTLKATSLSKHCYRLPDHYKEISVWKIPVELNKIKQDQAKHVRGSFYALQRCHLMKYVLIQKEIGRGPQIN